MSTPAFRSCRTWPRIWPAMLRQAGYQVGGRRTASGCSRIGVVVGPEFMLMGADVDEVPAGCPRTRALPSSIAGRSPSSWPSSSSSTALRRERPDIEMVAVRERPGRHLLLAAATSPTSSSQGRGRRGARATRDARAPPSPKRSSRDEGLDRIPGLVYQVRGAARDRAAVLEKNLDDLAVSRLGHLSARRLLEGRIRARAGPAGRAVRARSSRRADARTGAPSASRPK